VKQTISSATVKNTLSCTVTHIPLHSVIQHGRYLQITGRHFLASDVMSCVGICPDLVIVQYRVHDQGRRNPSLDYWSLWSALQNRKEFPSGPNCHPARAVPNDDVQLEGVGW
jgi:hypothetical protein